MIQFITHATERYTYADSARLALAGGCRWIQLRMKGASDEEALPVALEVQALCKKHHATFIIDDRVELAREIHADGVHLGKNDLPVDKAREILGKDYIIGGTANTFADVVMHYGRGADYIGCGPFRFTTTKQNLSPILGIEGYRQILRQMQDASIRLPLVAIGGISRADIPDIMLTGVNGIALSGTVLQAPDPIREMQALITMEHQLNNKQETQ